MTMILGAACTIRSFACMFMYDASLSASRIIKYVAPSAIVHLNASMIASLSVSRLRVLTTHL